jgi:histone deacetylase complex subunit SAP18
VFFLAGFSRICPTKYFFSTTWVDKSFMLDKMLKGGTLESVIVEEAEKTIDREKTCPLLLRVFCSTGRHNSLQDFSNGQVPGNELQIYTWMDATLKELSNLVKEVNPDARRAGTVFDFSLVYPDTRPRERGYRSRSIGTTISAQKTMDDNKSLAMVRFSIGDYLDIAITPQSRVMPMMQRRGRY